MPSLLLAPAYLSRLCLVAKDLNTLVDHSSLPKNSFPRIWTALSEAHAFLHPFFKDHFQSKPQSPLKKLFRKTPEDTWAIYTSPDSVPRSFLSERRLAAVTVFSKRRPIPSRARSVKTRGAARDPLPCAVPGRGKKSTLP